MRIHVDTPTGSRVVTVRGIAGVQRAVDLVFERDKLIVGELPPLYETGIRYKRERRGGLEDFKGADRCLREWREGNSKNGFDCDDLAPWRAAELVVSGVDPLARPFVYSPRRGLLHVIVARGDGTIEDPSAQLGMRNKVVNAMQYRFRNAGKGYVVCGLAVPVAGDKVRAKGQGKSRALALLDAEQRIIGILRGDDLEVGADGGAGILDALRTAGSRWEAVAPNKSGAYQSLVTPVREAVAFGTEIASMVDFSTPNNFLASLSQLAGMAGPYGQVVGAVLDLLNKVSDWLLKDYPAFAVQVFPEHYARMEAWLARNVLDITGGTDTEAITFMRAKGWVTMFGVESGQFANNSNPDFGSWWIDRLPPRTVEDNLRLLAMVAGPRAAPWGTKEISPTSLSAWLDSDEGRASYPIGEKLVQDLCGGPDQFSKGTWFDGRCTSWSSAGIKFVNYYPLDLDPGSRTFERQVTMVAINTTKLPDALAAPIAEYVTFRAGVKEQQQTWDNDTASRAAKAAFGNQTDPIPEGSRTRSGVGMWNPQTFQSWNLLRFLYHAMSTRDEFPLAVVGTLAEREGGVTDAPPVPDKPTREQPASGVPGAPLTRAGSGLQSLTRAGSGLQSLARSNTGLQLLPGAGVQDVTPQTNVPEREPLVAPITFDKLERIRELGEMVRDGSVRRVRDIIRHGGPLGRLARELLR